MTGSYPQCLIHLPLDGTNKEMTGKRLHRVTSGDYGSTDEETDERTSCLKIGLLSYLIWPSIYTETDMVDRYLFFFLNNFFSLLYIFRLK